MTERHTAPDEIIIVGYFLTEAREALRTKAEGGYGGNYVARAFWYLTEVFEREPAGRQALLDMDIGFANMMPSPGLFEAAEACEELAGYIGSRTRWTRGLSLIPATQMDLVRIEHQIGKAHSELAKMLKALHFRTITNEDFARVKEEYDLPGSGGGR